jgi:hypothetical protein
MLNEKTYYEQTYAVLNAIYGDNDFNSIINDQIAHEINTVLCDDLTVNKVPKINDIITRSYGVSLATKSATSAVMFASGKGNEITINAE